MPSLSQIFVQLNNVVLNTESDGNDIQHYKTTASVILLDKHIHIHLVFQCESDLFPVNVQDFRFIRCNHTVKKMK